MIHWPKISKEQFTEEYAKNSGVTIDELIETGFVAIPCDCDYEKCKGWQAVFVGKPEPQKEKV